MFRRVLSAVLALLVCSAATLANDPTNLAGGALLVHCPQEPLPAEICRYALHGVGAQNPMVIGNPGDEVTFIVIAAFDETKAFCGVQFGLGAYDPSVFTFTDWGACAGEAFVDYLELSTDNWPGPHSGTACVTTGDPWAERIVPFYYFTGIAYAEGVIPLDIDPAHEIAAFSNGKGAPELPELFVIPEDRLGALGIFTPGKAVEPETSIRWACCAGDDCLLLGELDCAALGGTWMGGLLSCFPGPCRERACCLDAEDTSVCVLMSELECADLGGIYMSETEACDPYPCPVEPELPHQGEGGSARQALSWGTIKALYR